MITNRELIGKYFDKNLTEEEKVLFKQKYETEPEFKQEIHLQAQIIAALKTSGLEKEILNMEPIDNAKKKPWLLYVSMTVAAAAILLLVIRIPFLNQKINGQDLLIAKLKEVSSATIRSSNDSAQKVLKEEIAQLQDSVQEIHRIGNQKINERDMLIAKLQEKQGRYMLDRSYFTDARLVLLALNQASDIEINTKGTGNFGFYPSYDQNQMSPNNIIIKWTPINQQGALYLYKVNEQNQRIKDGNFPKFNQDLNSGLITLKGLESNSLYVFMITLNETGEKYKFTFITR